MKHALILMFGLVLAFSPLQAQKLTIYYMPPTEELDIIKEYNLTLLKLALEKTKATHGEFEIISDFDSNLDQRDALKSLKDKSELYVVPTMTDGIRERVFTPVRVPLYKGLFGIRLLMINKNKADALSMVNSEAQLKDKILVQGSDWPDTQILKKNGFKVKELDQKEKMIGALIDGSADAYPRSIAEIWEEIDLHKDQPLTAQSKVYVYYPTAIYFFLQKTPEGKKAADRIENGLLLAVKDGSFDKAFQKYMGSVILKAKLDSKTLIKLKNPILPENTPLDNKDLWFIN
ncbi:hypothetical protein EP331_14345 [bacterium]|nr:MAG: hypothetical protein EP331_14345 [bacterium]